SPIPAGDPPTSPARLSPAAPRRAGPGQPAPAPQAGRPPHSSARGPGRRSQLPDGGAASTAIGPRRREVGAAASRGGAPSRQDGNRVTHEERSVRTVTGPTDRVVIVGAGLGGLSAALRLAGAGRQVTVLERETVPGGRAGMARLGDYRFDT